MLSSNQVRARLAALRLKPQAARCAPGGTDALITRKIDGGQTDKFVSSSRRESLNSSLFGQVGGASNRRGEQIQRSKIITSQSKKRRRGNGVGIVQTHVLLLRAVLLCHIWAVLWEGLIGIVNDIPPVDPLFVGQLMVDPSRHLVDVLRLRRHRSIAAVPRIGREYVGK